MRTHTKASVAALAIAALLAVGCVKSDRDAEAGSGNALTGFFGGSHVTVPAGTQIDVRLGQTVSSETAHKGDHWQGTVTSAVYIDGKEAIPAGATVEGVVVSTEEARRGSRARLELGVRSVHIGDGTTSLRASSEPVIAGSTRARNLGAIAGGAAAGALIGEATSGEARKGAIIGGAIATGAVAASKGYQVVLKNGTVMTFSVNDNVSVRLS
jgi:hypothetical protein